MSQVYDWVLIDLSIRLIVHAIPTFHIYTILAGTIRLKGVQKSIMVLLGPIYNKLNKETLVPGLSSRAGSES